MLNLSAFEERRTSEGRLVALRVFFAVGFGVLAVAFWLLQVVQHAKYEGAGRQQLSPDDSAARAARRALRPPRPRARREPSLVHDRRAPRGHEGSRSDRFEDRRRRPASRSRTIREAIERRRREPLFRPLPVIEHATFEQVAAVEVASPRAARGSRAAGARLATIRRRHGGAPVRVRRRDSGHAADADRVLRASAGRHHRSGRARADLQPRPAGRRRQSLRRRQQSRAARSTSSNEVPPVDGHRLQLTIDYDLQRALEDGFRAGNYNGAAAVLDPSHGRRSSR